MGQYYNPSILKTNHKLAKNPVAVSLYSWDFGNGLKLMEHSWAGNNFVGAFIHLIGENSPYFGKPCVWGGDYADSYRNRLSKPEEDADNIYFLANKVQDQLNKMAGFDEGISKTPEDLNLKYYHLFGKNLFYNTYDWVTNYKGEKYRRDFVDCRNNLDTYKYVINIRTKEYIEIPEPSDTDWIVHPLPILLADGNGRDGGDYHGSNMEFVGKWAFHPIGATNEIPKGYKKLDIIFQV